MRREGDPGSASNVMSKVFTAPFFFDFDVKSDFPTWTPFPSRFALGRG
jgi:hypothetical protein